MIKIKTVPLLTAAIPGLAFMLAPFFPEGEPEVSERGAMPAFEALVPLPRIPQQKEPTVIIYRWQDTHGTQHFSDEAPQDHPFQPFVLEGHTNLVPLPSRHVDS